MARWRLTASHYLKVPGNEWEYKEITSTGRQGRKMYLVPQLLDPEDPTIQNSEDGVIVCWEGKGMPKDIVFSGPPTPDMEPYDDEAKAISDAERPNWNHPIESLTASTSMIPPEHKISRRV